MKRKHTLHIAGVIVIGIVVALGAYATWYTWHRHAVSVQTASCEKQLEVGNAPKMRAPDDTMVPVMTPCLIEPVPPSLGALLTGHTAPTDVPEHMIVNPYTLWDALLGRYSVSPNIGAPCNQSATTTGCLSAAEIIAKKQADPGFTPTPGSDKTPPPPMLGIQAAISPTILGEANLMLGTNTWKGYVDGMLTTVTGTAYKDNPSQGVLFVWVLATTTASGLGNTWTYPAPTATGPLKIISEASGVITATSLAGTYEVYDINTDTRHYVATTGGTTYTFDIQSRMFQ